MTPIDRPPWLNDAAWPWPICRLTTPAGSIAVTDVGEGPTLLLSHVGMWSFLWRDLIRDLCTDHRIVAFDAPGTGLSARPDSATITIDSAAQAIGALIDSLDLTNLTLVMHDIGGPAAIAAVADRSDRVAKIVAINTFAWRPAGALFRSMLAAVGSLPVREFDALTNALPMATSTRFGVGRHWSAVDRRVFRRAFDRPARRAVHRYLGDAGHDDTLFERTEAALAGPLADRPLLTIFGERNDPLKLQPEWKRRFPHAIQRVVPGGNHFPMCDAPGDVAAWIRDFHSSS